MAKTDDTRGQRRTARLGADHPPPGADAEPVPPRPSRRARLGARWHHSLPLRVVTAVIVALLIGGIGFAAGTALSGDDQHRSHHEISANHPFWQDREGWFHRGEHLRHHVRLAPAAPSATPAPEN